MANPENDIYNTRAQDDEKNGKEEVDSNKNQEKDYTTMEQLAKTAARACTRHRQVCKGQVLPLKPTVKKRKAQVAPKLNRANKKGC